MTEPFQQFCSFCAKRRESVKTLIVGPQVSICDECVMLCLDIIPRPIGCATAGEAMAAQRATDAESARWVSSPMIRDEHPLLLARLGELEAKVAADANKTRLGELHAKRWLWMARVIREEAIEDWTDEEEEEAAKLRRRVCGLPDDWV